MKKKNLLFLVYGIIFLVVGFNAEKPVLALILGGIPIALFVIFTIADLKSNKKNSNKTTANVVPKKTNSQNKSNWTNPETKYYVNVKQFDGSLTIGSYYRGHGDHEELALIRKNAKWFVKGTAMWPVHRGASNGGQYEYEINADFFEETKIESVKQFLIYFLKGETEPCISLAMKEEDLVMLLGNIIDTKGQYVPEGEPPVDSTHIRYKFDQEFRAHNQRLKQQAHKYPLIVASEFLFSKGFVFCRAAAVGGINEISHTGDKAYSVEYIDFIDFRDNFEKDMEEAEKFEVENSGGWVSSLNYGSLDVYLKRKELRVGISVDGSTVRVNWYDVSDPKDPIFDELNQKILEVLGEKVNFEEETCFKYDFGEKFEKNYLSNWDIHHRIEYWLNDDTGGVVREVSAFEFEYLRKGETKWTKLQPDNSFEREVYLGQGNNCLTKITPEEAETIIKEWYSDIKIDTITVIK